VDLFFEIGLLIIFAGAGIYLARLTKQPLVPAYIISGIIIGKLVGIVTNQDMISKLSEIGIAFLLFMVGLEMEFKKLKDIGFVSSVVGTIQVAFIFFAGYIVTKLLGFSRLEATYLGMVIAFSSTMVVIKILSDNLEINTIHGRLIIGILVVQDILAIIALSYLASLSDKTDMTSVLMLKLLLVVVAGILLSRFILPRVFEFAAKSGEVLLGVSLSICFLFALVFNSLGLSMSIGAFIAGVLLANLPYNIEIVGKIRPLRDFFAILFFTSLGLQLEGSIGYSMVPILIALLILTLVIKPLVIFSSVWLLGHTPRNSFLTAISLGQISEFSLIIVMQGMMLGVIPDSALTLTILLAILTMASTSYFMKYERKLYHHMYRLLKIFGFSMHESHTGMGRSSCDVLLCGYDRIGYSILNSFRSQNRDVLVVDFNPDVIERLKNMGVSCIYGDICDPEVTERIDVKNAKIVISTANSFEDNMLLLQRVKSINKYVPTIVTAHKIDQALELYKSGADYVILPHFLGGDMVSSMLPEFESNNLESTMLKYRHIADLIDMKNVGCGHPARVRS